MKKLCTQINKQNASRINANLKRYPLLNGIKVFDPAFDQPISKWLNGRSGSSRT